MNHIGTQSGCQKVPMHVGKTEHSLERSRAKSRESRVLLMKLLQDEPGRSPKMRKQGDFQVKLDPKLIQGPCGALVAPTASSVSTVSDSRTRENDGCSRLSRDKSSSAPFPPRLPTIPANASIEADTSVSKEKGIAIYDQGLAMVTTHLKTGGHEQSLLVHTSSFPSPASNVWKNELGPEKANEIKSVIGGFGSNDDSLVQSSASLKPTTALRKQASERPKSHGIDVHPFNTDLSLSEGVEFVKNELKRVQEEETTALRKVDQLQSQIQGLKLRKRQLKLRLKQAETAARSASADQRAKGTTAPSPSSSNNASRKRRRDTSSVATAPPIKHPVVSTTSLVHHACRRHPGSESVMAGAIRVDPEGVSRRLAPSSIAKRGKHESDYEYPINIAIQEDATVPVLELLTNAGKDILAERDGPEKCCSLSCALYKRRSIDVVSLLLEANPNQAHISDRQKNYPLHVACLAGSSLPVIKLLVTACRAALSERNLQGHTPLEVAQQHDSRCSGEVVDYLQLASFGMLEECMTHSGIDEYDEERW